MQWLSVLHNVNQHSGVAPAAAEQHLLALKLPGEQHNRLHEDDFMLAFCSSFQLKKFLEHGSRVVGMDGTHGTAGMFHLKGLSGFPNCK